MVVGRLGHATAAEGLDPLVVAVDGTTADVDRGEAAVLVGENDDGGIDITGLPDRGINPNAAEGVDRLDLATGHIAGHVEVVDRHVVEDAARDLDVGDRRRGRITAGDVDDLDITVRTIGNGIGNRLVGRIEPAIEADVQWNAGSLDRCERPVDFSDVEADRLFAEDRPTGFGRRDHDVDVGVGGGADRDRVGVDRQCGFEVGGDGNAKFDTDVRGRFSDDIEHADDLGAGDPAVKISGVHGTDSATAEHDETNGHRETPSLSMGDGPGEYSAGLVGRSTPTATPSAAADAAAASTTAWAA